MRCAACGSHTEFPSTINFMQIWQEQHEWTDFPQKGGICKDCVEWMKSQDFQDRLYNDPLPQVTGPQRWENTPSTTVIGIFDGLLLGLRCAKIKHGADAITEIAQGFYYEDKNGRHIIRVTAEDESEDQRCDKCWLQLWQCNAMEVTV